MESLMLALMGSALGLLIGRVAITAILRLDPDAVPRLAESTIDSSCTCRDARSHFSDGVDLWTGASTRVMESEP